MSVTPSLTRIQSADNAIIASIIREVLTEFGANRPGFAFVDPDLDDLTHAFSGEKAGYWLARLDGEIVGGAGFGPLLGGQSETCELKKMYLLPKARGLGFGKLLMLTILDAAAKAGYQQIYLETTATMHDAMSLYQSFGFERLAAPLGETGHFGCEAQFARSLTTKS